MSVASGIALASELAILINTIIIGFQSFRKDRPADETLEEAAAAYAKAVVGASVEEAALDQAIRAWKERHGED